MSVNLLKNLNFAEKINAVEAITEAGKELLGTYRAYVYANPATCSVVNGFVAEASKYRFDTGLNNILESVTSFIKENNISWKLATACESINANNSTYNYINKFGMQQVEKLLQMDEADVVSYIKAGSLKNIQYIPEVRSICKEVYKQNVTEAQAVNYSVINPICYVLEQGNEIVFKVLNKTFTIKEGKVEECANVDNADFARINSLLENFGREGDNLVLKYSNGRDLETKFILKENAIEFTRGAKIDEKFEDKVKFTEYCNMLSKTMQMSEKLSFMNIASMVSEVFEHINDIYKLDNVKVLNCNNGTLCAIIEGKENVNLTVFHNINRGTSSQNYEYVVEALNQVIKLTGIDLKEMYESRINEDCKKSSPERQAIEKELAESKSAQYEIRKKKIAMLAEQYKNDPVKMALLNKIAKDLSILERETPITEQAKKLNNKIANEILKVITNYPEFDPNDFGKWGKEIAKKVNDWVNKNDVNDVEFTVSSEELESLYGDPDSIKEVTDKKINFVKDHSSLQKKMNDVLGKNYDGPGWNGMQRYDNRWNDTYFFTGSDATHYVLVQKIG